MSSVMPTLAFNDETKMKSMDSMLSLINSLCKELKCAHCNKFSTELTCTFPCEHTFCKTCLTTHPNFMARKCPHCDENLSLPYFTQCCVMLRRVLGIVGQLETAAHSIEITQHQDSNGGTSAHVKASKPSHRNREPAAPVKNWRKEAQEAYEEGQYKVAAHLYTKAISALTQSKCENSIAVGPLYANRSAAYFMQRKFRESLRDCESVISATPFASYKIYLRATKSCIQLGELEKARDYYMCAPDRKESDRQAIDLLQNSIDVLNHAIQAQLDGDWEMCKKQYEILVENYPDTVPFLCQLSLACYKTGCPEQAQEALAIAVAKNKVLVNDSVVVFEMARAHYFQGFEYFRLAKKYIDRASLEKTEDIRHLQKCLERLDDLKQRGNERFQAHDWKVAIDAYTEAMEVDSRNTRVMKILLCNRAAAFKELGQPRRGVEDCTKAIELDPHFFKAFVRRARCYQLLEDHESACKDFQMANKIDPEDRDVRQELRAAEGRLLREQNKDHYETLGITRHASDKDIKLRYRELSLRWHPDKCMGFADEERTVAEKRFKAVNEAYNILSDIQKRKEYDLKLDRQRLRASFAENNYYMSGTSGSGLSHANSFHHSSTSSAHPSFHHSSSFRTSSKFTSSASGADGESYFHRSFV